MRSRTFPEREGPPIIRLPVALLALVLLASCATSASLTVPTVSSNPEATPTPTSRPTAEPTPDLEGPWEKALCPGVRAWADAFDAYSEALTLLDLYGDAGSFEDWAATARDYIAAADDALAEAPDWPPGRGLVSAMDHVLRAIEQELDAPSESGAASAARIQALYSQALAELASLYMVRCDLRYLVF